MTFPETLYSYYGYNTIYDNDILVLSDKILRIDSQTGEVIDELFDNDNYDYIGICDDSIIVHNESGFYKYSDGKLNDIDYSYTLSSNDLSTPWAISGDCLDIFILIEQVL